MSIISGATPSEVFTATLSTDTYNSPANPYSVLGYGSAALAPLTNPTLTGGNKDAASWLSNFIPTLVNTTAQPVTGVSNKTGSSIPNRSYKGVTVTPDNYSALALQEIERQRVEVFNGQTPPNDRQVAIVDAFRQLAGLASLTPQSTADFLAHAADELGLAKQAQKFVNTLGSTTGEVLQGVGDVAKAATSPIGLTAILIIGGVVAAVVLLK